MNGQKSIDAAISYQYSFSIFDQMTPMSDEQKLKSIRQALEKRFPGCVVGDSDPGAQNQSVLRDLHTVQDFLHGGKLPFVCRRFLICGMDLTFAQAPLRSTAVLLSIFPEFNVAQLMFCFDIEGATPDQLIFLRQIFGGAAPFRASDGFEAPLRGQFERLAGAMGCRYSNVDQMYLIEIKAFRPYQQLSEVLAHEQKLIYGIVCGDEGWEYVPAALAESRLQNQWGSRDFVRFIVFGSSAVLFNLYGSPDGQRYLERQRDFGGRAYGGVNPYFLINSPVAGVGHGILLSQELVVVIKTIANRILNQKNGFTQSKMGRLGQDIRRTKLFRSQLITTLNRVENLGISEIGELEQMLLRSYRITPLIDSIKYLLELLESELDLLYQQSTNRLVNILTVAGLVLSVAGLLQSFF